ncbi:MAG: DNA polymerase [Salibaculum sp.]|nr:DNA polymerase [Salibaculum sp.]MDR9428808.1 DNA polymerase [Salibaculum sp.]
MKDKYDSGTDDFLLKHDINNIETEWSAPTEFPDLRNCKTIAVDLETRDNGIGAGKGPGWATNDGYVVGIAVAAGDFYGYFPIRHANGPNLDVKMTLKWLQDQMATPNITKVFHNAPYDVGWMLAEGIKVQGPIIDTLIAAPLVDENRFSYRLDLLGKEYLGMRKDEKILRAAAAEWGIDPKAEMWKLPARFVGGYGEQDAALTLKLWDYMKGELEKQELWSVFDLETRVLPGVIDMRAKGVRVDLDQAERSRKILRQRKQELLKFVKDQTGVEVEVWAADSVKKVFDEQQIPHPTTEAGAPSFTKDFLKDHPNEIAQVINKVREADKADSTFIDSILKYEHDGRIHCEMHQLRGDDGGTVTGRFCVAADTQVVTRKGLKPIVSIQPGKDEVLTHKGRWRPVRFKVYKGVERMYLVRTLGGVDIKCTLNHRFLTTHGWQTLGELIDGSEQTSIGGQRVMSSACGRLLESGSAVHQDLGSTVSGERAHCSRGAAPRAGSRNHATRARETAEVHEDRVEKPYVRKEIGGVSQLRRALRGWPRLLNQEDWGQEVLCASNSVCGAAGFASITASGVSACASHRWGFEEQRPKQPCTGDRWWPSTDTFSIVEIEENHVWDIEVVEDHSYIAGGAVNHNSSSSPNLQQLPARDPEIKKLIRGIFVPEEGTRWGSFDYASQEPRLLTHFAASLPQRMRGDMVDKIVAEFHTGGADLHQMVADMAGISRKQAKTVNLGIMYGMGKGKLANQLGVSEDEAKRLLDLHTEKVPFVRKLASVASDRAEKQGQIRTVMGRLCRFDMWEPRGFGYNKPLKYEEAVKTYGTVGPGICRAFTYKALNRLIQGSAADQTKLAFAECYEAGLPPMLQVHDELAFSIENDDQAKQIVEIMENGLKLNVPSKVDVALETNWGDVE